MNINRVIKEMESFASREGVPIMQNSSLSYILDYISEEKIESVLEIGTAIGYSAIRMSTRAKNITSIERDENRYKEAVKNVKKACLEDKIELIFSDAFDTDITKKYDMILIDAAKGKNKEFIEKFKRNLKKGGTIIIDNIDFHGLVGNSSEIKSRNLRSLVRKIENFLEYLKTQDEFSVTKIDKGDGLIILK